VGYWVGGRRTANELKAAIGHILRGGVRGGGVMTFRGGGQGGQTLGRSSVTADYI